MNKEGLTVAILLSLYLIVLSIGVHVCIAQTIKKSITELKKPLEKIAQNTTNKDLGEEPTKVQLFENNEKPSKTYYGYCPTCGELVSNRYRRCEKCDQLLNWGDKRDE